MSFRIDLRGVGYLTLFGLVGCLFLEEPPPGITVCDDADCATAAKVCDDDDCAGAYGCYQDECATDCFSDDHCKSGFACDTMIGCVERCVEADCNGYACNWDETACEDGCFIDADCAEDYYCCDWDEPCDYGTCSRNADPE